MTDRIPAASDSYFHLIYWIIREKWRQAVSVQEGFSKGKISGLWHKKARDLSYGNITIIGLEINREDSGI